MERARIPEPGQQGASIRCSQTDARSRASAESRPPLNGVSCDRIRREPEPVTEIFFRAKTCLQIDACKDGKLLCVISPKPRIIRDQ